MGKHSRGGSRGRTNFENHDLDDMIDLVESARPSDMIAVADALVAVARQIAEAGSDLGSHLDDVEWEGESAKAFRTWGKDLAKNTLKLGDYANAVGQEMGHVGFGLSSVQHSMPTRADGKGGAVGEIPAPARVVTNKDYVKAKAADDAKHEAARQDAITEMNKLSSYYRVSEEQLAVASQDAPVFKPPGNMGVPQPPGGNEKISPGTTPGVEHGNGGSGVSPRRSYATPSVDHEVGTDLDSVAMPDSPTVEPASRPSAPSDPNEARHPVGRGPVLPGPLGPNTFQPSKATRQTPSILGQGRPSPTGQKGPTGTSTPSLPGRPGSGGTGPTGMGTGRPATSGPSRGGRSDGVVGGTPQRPGERASARLPRGTVIGGEGAAAGRGGVASGGAANRRLASSPGGAVGTPRSDTGRLRGAKDFTPGGTGLVKGASARRDATGSLSAPRTSAGRRTNERDGSTRPEYLSEDQETWTTQRRDIVPPVID